jgi:hypothetical protein
VGGWGVVVVVLWWCREVALWLSGSFVTAVNFQNVFRENKVLKISPSTSVFSAVDVAITVQARRREPTNDSPTANRKQNISKPQASNLQPPSHQPTPHPHTALPLRANKHSDVALSNHVRLNYAPTHFLLLQSLRANIMVSILMNEWACVCER